MADDFSGKTGDEGETRAMKGESDRLTASTPLTSYIATMLDWSVSKMDPGSWIDCNGRHFMRLRDNDPRGLWMEDGCGPSILPCSNCGSLESSSEGSEGVKYAKITCSECNATTGWCVRPDERNAWNNDPLDLSYVRHHAESPNLSSKIKEVLRNTPLPSIEDIVTPPMQIPDPSSSQLLIALALIALADLEAAEAAYRKIHDLAGDDNIETGRAWDRMRRCGDQARMALAPYRQVTFMNNAICEPYVEKKEEE